MVAVARRRGQLEQAPFGLASISQEGWGVTLRPGSPAGHLRELRPQWRAQDSLRLAAIVLEGDHLYLSKEWDRCP